MKFQLININLNQRIYIYIYTSIEFIITPALRKSTSRTIDVTASTKYAQAYYPRGIHYHHSNFIGRVQFEMDRAKTLHRTWAMNR